jgi:uncharacterized Zn finger protein
MAKSRSGVADRWAALTWDDLEGWAGARSVERGRSYQRGGRVKDLRVAEDGAALLATVLGGNRYATTVALGPGRGPKALEGSCTCPVGYNCKHAVATVAEYLQAIADGRAVPVASDDDPRWDALEGDGEAFAYEDEWDDEESWDDEEEYVPTPSSRKTSSTSRPKPGPVDWDAKIEAHLRSKSREELADLAWSLVKRFPTAYAEFRERLSLRDSDVDGLVAEARRAIKKATAEPVWRNNWTGEGNSTDYGPVRKRLERLLELGHADEVVALGREFLRRGMEQIGSSHDEGETASDFAECLPVVFEAVMQSSLTEPERVLFAIDAELMDDYGLVDDGSALVLDAEHPPEVWSAVADALIRRLKAGTFRGDEDEEGDEGDSFSRNYARDRLTSRIANALDAAGRADELPALYESEARTTGSYERLVAFLIEQGCLAEAERAALEGIEATVDRYPGIADHLAASLCDLAKQRKQWDVVAAHAARKFFEYPSAHGFGELVEAAKKAGAEEPVRASALRFLETGVLPFRLVAPRARPAPAPRGKSRSKGRAAAEKAKPSPAPEPVKIDPSWPLPVPGYLVPIMSRFVRIDAAAGPRLDVLLEMAIAAKRPDEVLRWFDRMRSEAKGRHPYYSSAPAYADRVAEAVAKTHPERALEVYRVGLDAQLPNAQMSAYEAAVGYLKKLRPIYGALGRPDEWDALVASIREKYRNRPRFMELLDTLEGRTIVQSARAKKR